jgi:hypothetical protein
VAPHDFGHEAAIHRRVLNVTERRLDRLHDLLVSRKKWAEGLGAEFLFVIAPDKTSIYPEFLPDWFDPIEGPSLTDQLVARLQAAGDVDFLDLRPALKEAKRGGRPLYYAGDTHWNSEGAFVGSSAVARWLHARHPAVEPLGDDDLVRARVRYQGDLSRLLHLESSLEESSILARLKSPRSAPAPFPGDPTPIATWSRPAFALQVADPRLPKALIYHDSFAEGMTPFLAECFQTSVFVPDLRITRSTTGGFKPDIVIFECVERTLYPLAGLTDDLIPAPEPALIAEVDDQLRPRRR